MDLASTVAEALESAHRESIVHRDIKPSNILLDGDGKPMLADFGLARMLEESAGLTGSNLALGTPEYMAPEQALGLPADQRSDLYALGVILYRMLLGQTPFRAGTALATMMAHVHLPPPPPRSLDPDIDPRLDAILLKTLAKDPDDRYETPWRSFGPTRRGVSEGLGDPQQNTFGWSPDRSGRLAAMPYRGGGGEKTSIWRPGGYAVAAVRLNGPRLTS